MTQQYYKDLSISQKLKEKQRRAIIIPPTVCVLPSIAVHLDAPIHFAKNKLTVDQIPLSSLTGYAVKIDVSRKALVDRDCQVSVEDIENWEKENGSIPYQIIRSSFSGQVMNNFTLTGKNISVLSKTGPAAIPELHFPGILPKATQWLVEKRNIKALRLDTPSMDYGQSKEFKSYQILLGHDKPGFENLTNLDQLPAKRIYIVALPMKIAKGSGGPLRIIATFFYE